MHGGQGLALAQGFTDTGDAILPGGQPDDLETAPEGSVQAGEEGIGVVDAGVDDDQFQTDLSLGLGRRRQPVGAVIEQARLGGQCAGGETRRQVGGIEDARFQFFDDGTVSRGGHGLLQRPAEGQAPFRPHPAPAGCRCRARPCWWPP
jgi:hypothetical protein